MASRGSMVCSTRRELSDLRSALNAIQHVIRAPFRYQLMYFYPIFVSIVSTQELAFVFDTQAPPTTYPSPLLAMPLIEKVLKDTNLLRVPFPGQLRFFLAPSKISGLVIEEITGL